LKPFRTFAWGVYLVAAVGFSCLIIFNVVRSVIIMSPGKMRPDEVTLTIRECIELSEDLWNQLEHQRQQLGSMTPVGHVDQAWYQFRLDWMRRLRDAQARCAIESHERKAISSLFARLERLQVLYTTHAVQYAGEVGGTVDGFREALERAKREPSAGRFR